MPELARQEAEPRSRLGRLVSSSRRVAGEVYVRVSGPNNEGVTNARWLTAIALASMLAQATALVAVLWRR